MSKYKVGDKVRIIRALGSSVERGLKYGDETEIIQTIQSSSGHTDYILRCPNPLYVGDGGFFLEHEIEPIEGDNGIYVGTLNSTIVPDRRAEMQKAVAEMIVELLNQDENVSLYAHRGIGLTTVEIFPHRTLGHAVLRGSDEWDTLTGLYVALSKATNRKLPDWIYEKESNDE